MHKCNMLLKGYICSFMLIKNVCFFQPLLTSKRLYCHHVYKLGITPDGVYYPRWSLTGTDGIEHCKNSITRRQCFRGGKKTFKFIKPTLNQQNCVVTLK